MIKIHLTRSIAEPMNIHTQDAEILLTTFTEIIGDCLASGEPVRLAGGGVIDVRHVAAHLTRNPKEPANLSPSLHP